MSASKIPALRYPSTVEARRRLGSLQEKYYPSPAIKVKQEELCAELKIPKSHLPLLLLECYFQEMERTGKVPASMEIDYELLKEIKANKY